MESTLKTYIREKYHRFKAWQQNPFDYEMPDRETRHCHNCGYDFVGNYCPRCSQKAGVKTLTWKSVREGVMDIWGIGTRSMTYTIVQLFFRPGYLIHDYVTGKRQVSFPPVKMLLIVALILTIVENLLFPDASTPPEPAMNSDYMDTFFEWTATNPGWGVLAIWSFLIIPIWILFRYAPRLPFHTLPQGFFIQVFMCVQLLLIVILSGLSDYILLLVPILYVWTFVQLFGYNVWSTLWRIILSTISACMTLTLPIFFSRFFQNDTSLRLGSLAKYIGSFSFLIFGIFAPLAIGYAINRRIQKKQMQKS